MKTGDSISIGWRGVVLAAMVIAAGLFEPAYCQTGPVLLLQQSPAKGGTITPAVGVHHFGLNTEVTLTAVPEPGYQFVYWMGDVSDPAASTTVAYLDAPKIIIAIFERSKYEFAVMDVMSQGASGGSGLIASAADYSRTSGGGGGGKRPSKFRWPSPSEQEPADFPVPDENDHNDSIPVPEPIPEPATAVLLALGSLFVFARGRSK